MDTDDYSEILKHCYKCEEDVLQNLNIIYNATNSTIAVWNKFQIFVYENMEFECAAKTITPEFQIQDLLLSNNYLVCLDSFGNVQVISLKFKNLSQKRFKPSFQPKEQNIVAIISYVEDYTLSLKLESNTYFLLLNRTSTEFQLERKVFLTSVDKWQLPKIRNKYIFHSHLISEKHIDDVKKTFKTEDSTRGHWSIVVISFDRIVIYSCLYNSKSTEDTIDLHKLYTSPSEICSIDINESTDVHLIIGLTIGTLIRLSLKDPTTKPEVIHLNVALYKTLTFNNTIIYTDGVSLWKADNIFSDNIKFTKLFVKQAKDFVKCGDQVVCTTFTNLIYTFQIDDEKSYIKLQTVDEYCSAEKLLNNAEYIQKIMEEVNKNNTLVHKLNREGNYITALSISNRQDIMENIISCKVIVYENYHDAITENIKVTLTEEIANYHDTGVNLLLVNIATAADHKLNEILTNTLGDLKIHITLSYENKLLKTNSIKIMGQLQKTNLLIPLMVKNFAMTHVDVNIKLISILHGALDAKQTVSTVLYRKTIRLNSENFIKTNLNTDDVICLKETTETLDELVKQVSLNQYGNLFDFNLLSKAHYRPHWCLYVKLPKNFKEMLKNKKYYENKLSLRKSNYFIELFSSEDFLTSKNSLTFTVNNDKVKVEVEDDSFSSPVLKLTCGNMKIALNFRNFFSNVFYNNFTNIDIQKEFINHNFYTTVENYQKSIQDCVGSSQSQLLPLIEQFEKHIIGSLPI